MNKFYFINAFFEIGDIENGNIMSIDLRRAGNCFETKEEAMRMLQRIRLAVSTNAIKK